MTILHVLDHTNDNILDTLNEYWEDIHKINLKKEETLDFSFLPSHKASEVITGKNRIVVEIDNEFREFIIYETKLEGQEKQVYTYASYLELKNDRPLDPIILNGQTINSILDHILFNTDWERGYTDYSGLRKVTFDQYITPYDALKQIESLFNLELSFRVVVEGNKVVGRYVDARGRIGEWNGKEVVTGKDLIALSRKENTDNIVTALIALGPEEEGGTRKRIEVTNTEARLNWGRNGRHIWGIYEPQVEEGQTITESRLQQLAQTELNKRISSVVEYTVDVANIESVFNREHEKVKLGDQVRIKATEYNPAIYLDSRVIAIEGSIKDRSQKTYTLGEFIEYSEEDIETLRRELSRRISEKVGITDLLNVTYTKEEIDHKDTAGNEAKEKLDQEVGHETIETVSGAIAKDLQVQQVAVEEAKQEAENYINENAVKKENYQLFVQETTQNLADKANLDYVNGQLRLKADTSIINDITNNVSDLETELSNKVDAQWVNGQLQTKADVETTYTKSEVDNALDNKLEVTTYTTDRQGIITNLESHESRISQNETDISSKVEITTFKQLETDLGTIETNLDNAITSINQNASDITSKAEQTTVNTIIDDLGTVQSNVNNHNTLIQQNAKSIQSKAEQNTVDTLSGNVSSLSSTVSQHANLISNKVEQTEFNTATNTMNNRLTNIEQTTDSITQEVSQINADLGYLDVIDLEGTGKKFTNLGGLSLSDSSVRGSLVIKTPITYSYMTRVSITGYNYVDSKVDIDITVSFYAYTGGSFHQTNYKSMGNHEISNVRLGRENGKAVIIIDDVSKVWQYPKISIDEAIIGHQEPPNDYKNGWSVSFETNLSNYTNLVNVSGSDIQQTITSQKTLIDQNKTAITQRATKTELNTLEGRVKTAEGQITTMAGQINLKADSSTVTSLSSRVTSAEIAINGLNGEISSKVSTSDFNGNNIVSRINQTATNVAISASKINLNGAVTFSSFNSDVQNRVNQGTNAKSTVDQWKYGNTTYIDGGNIYANSIDTNSLKAGEISGVTIRTSNTSNYIHMENQELKFINENTEKMTIGFLDKESSRVNTPYIIMGAGIRSDGRGRGIITKDSDHWRFEMWDANNRQNGIRWHTETGAMTAVSGGKMFFYANGTVDFVNGQDIVNGGRAIDVRELNYLWGGSVYPRGDQTIYPSKRIQNCNKGWALLWSDYDVGVGANDYNWVWSFIPKRQGQSFSGEGVYVIAPHGGLNATPYAKYLYIHDHAIVGHDDNNKSPLNDVVLRYVYEI